MSTFTESQHPRGQAGRFTEKAKPGAGVSLAGPPGEPAPGLGRLSQAVQDSNRECQDALQHAEALSAGVCAELVSAHYPAATGLVLEPSDQGDYWEGAEVLGAGGRRIGHWGDGPGDDEAASYLSNLNCYSKYGYVDTATGRPILDLGAARQHATEAGSTASDLQGRTTEAHSAQAHFQDVLARNESLSASLVAATVTAQHPQATHLVVDASDQGDFWAGEAILDSAGGEVGSFGEEELLDTDADLALSNLNCFKAYPYISQDAQGRWAMDLQAARNATP